MKKQLILLVTIAALATGSVFAAAEEQQVKVYIKADVTREGKLINIMAEGQVSMSEAQDEGKLQYYVCRTILKVQPVLYNVVIMKSDLEGRFPRVMVAVTPK